MFSEPDGRIYEVLITGIYHASGDVFGFLHAGDVNASFGVFKRGELAFHLFALPVIYFHFTQKLVLVLSFHLVVQT